jgi:hypothetical protein
MKACVISKRVFLTLVLALVMSVAALVPAFGMSNTAQAALPDVTPGWQNMLHWSTPNQTIPEGQDYIELLLTLEWGGVTPFPMNVMGSVTAFEAGALTLESATLVSGGGSLNIPSPSQILTNEVQAINVQGMGGYEGPVEILARFSINAGFLETPGSTLDLRIQRSVILSNPYVHVPLTITRQGIPTTATVTKTLTMPEGTTPPAATFAFEFERTIARVMEDPIRYSRPVANVPNITPNPTITLDPTLATTASGITTVVGELDLMALLDTLTFQSGGVYVWNVREVPNSSGTVAPSTMTYDTTRFQIRAHTDRDANVHAVEVFELNYVAGSWIVGNKLNNDGALSFNNTYRRLAGNQDVNGLEITKNVTGQHANLSTPFSFTLNLTQHSLAPLTFPITAHILNADNTTTAANITSANHTFTLMHDQRLVIPQIYAGTTWNVTEAAHIEFAPRVNVIVGGTQVHSVTDAAPNTALSSGDRLVHDSGRNAADFTNDHQWSPPLGLDIANAPFIIAALVLISLALLLTTRKRREIESMPVTD